MRAGYRGGGHSPRVPGLGNLAGSLSLRGRRPATLVPVSFPSRAEFDSNLHLRPSSLTPLPPTPGSVPGSAESLIQLPQRSKDKPCSYIIVAAWLLQFLFACSRCPTQNRTCLPGSSICGFTLLASWAHLKHKGQRNSRAIGRPSETEVVLKMGPVGAEADENQTIEAKVELNGPGHTTPRGELSPDPEPELIDSTKLVEVQVVLILAYCSIILLGVVGNSLVIHVVIKFKSMRTVTNFFIANLAVADLLVNTLCLPFTLTYTLMGEWKMGPVLCHLVPYSQGLAVQVSTITLTVIALDRHRCIVYHLESKISKRISFLIIGLAWGISALLASPLAIFREYSLIEIIPDFEIVACTEKWPGEEKSVYGTVYSLSTLLILYVLPLGIISFSYARIWSKLKNHVSPGAAGDHYHQRRHKTTKMLVCVVVVFAVSWLPLHAFQLAVDIDSHVLDLKEYKLIFTVLHIIAMCSTFANPLLYGWMNSNYRKAFLSAFRCEQRLDAIHSEVSMTFKTKKNLEVKKNNGPTDSFSEATNV